MYRIGFDIGSTTIKAVVLDENNKICYRSYERHKAQVRQKALEKIIELRKYTKEPFTFALSGSGALGLSEQADLPFVQEVFASAMATKKLYPQTDVAIELGGEDAKILFFKGNVEQRMNSQCAGGTGAFIDQMAQLLDMSLEEMNEASQHFHRIYPIASRCGVFAKSDIQPLINQGVDKADLCASIFQAVVGQTITSLAQGYKIEGNLLFLGGPLYFLSGLRQRFKETLELKDEQINCPETAIHYVALGTALCAETVFEREQLEMTLEELVHAPVLLSESEPLFQNEQEYEQFRQRHHSHDAKYLDLATYTDKAYLGIDSGSTTTKLALIAKDGEILYESYSSNKGNPLDVVLEDLKHIYQTNPDIQIYGAYATGYGEELMRHAFHLDGGVVETLAHYTAAKQFNPNVDYILDIGGQDIKCFKIRDGHIDDIVLNEACSSGCGSFIETFANSLGYDSISFAKLGLKSSHPVDLGTRCTVFMNSGVKQAQKNGATVEDISAGLCRSVVRNALYKVIRTRNKEEIGKNIVVQGGTFQNDAVLRSFEQELGYDVIRPSIAHLMGAYGAALYARKLHRTKSAILTYEQLLNFSHTSKSTVCQLCNNHCSLTINEFSDGSRLIAGNKCERPTKVAADKLNLPDMYKIKMDLLNEYKKKFKHEKRIGMPLVLNHYDLLPFWSRFFDSLSVQVVWSTPSTLAMYQSAQHTIPSDTACYPAKVVHGHIQQLMDMKMDTIFYPCMTYNVDEKQSDNHYNCPIVAYYPQVIEANMDLENVSFISPFLSFDDEKTFIKAIQLHFKKAGMNFSKKDLKIALHAGANEYNRFKEQLHRKHEECVQYAREHHLPMALLCGRPYHLDPLINHQIHQLLTSLGFVVLSEESVPDQKPHPVDVLNQWTYHARLYQAANYACRNEDMHLIQLVSFGCGLDAVTTDEVKAILKRHNKFYTQIKIDEVDNLGATKIRLRSLKGAIEEKQEGDRNVVPLQTPSKGGRVSMYTKFTPEMKETHTILVPSMLPIHFKFLVPVFAMSGYHVEVLKTDNDNIRQEGLSHVHNDMCYPALLVIGQMIDALKSGQYDMDHTALAITQTAGGCRASNYLSLLRKALEQEGWDHIPCISANLSGLEKDSGVQFTLPLIIRTIYAFLYGDALMWLKNQVKPYEIHAGQTDRVVDEIAEEIVQAFEKGTYRKSRRIYHRMLEKMKSIERSDEKKIRVGIVGEIYMKYSPLGNQNLEEYLIQEGFEPVLSGVMDFALYSIENGLIDYKYYHMHKRTVLIYQLEKDIIMRMQKIFIAAVKKDGTFRAPDDFSQVIKNGKPFINPGVKMGEGWLLTSEVVSLIKEGVENVIMCQPFGCLPNHIVAKGMTKKIKEEYPNVNIAPIDYDPSASKVNQENRIKLMMANAKLNAQLKEGS